MLLKPSSGERCALLNFVLLVILQGARVRLMSSHHVPRRAPNKTGYGKIDYKHCFNAISSRKG